MNQKPERWTAEGLLHEIKQLHAHHHERSIAFILGAGASITSGIPAGGTLAQEWLKESYLRRCLNQKEETLEQWAKRALNAEDFSLTQAATHYSKIFELRFGRDPKSGYAALEAKMEAAEPGLGYSILARLLDETRHRVVVTTNFDNLVADALAIHALKHPLIVGHESLAGFVRPQLARPLVAKIHRDLHLDPKNDSTGVDTLEEGWKTALNSLFGYFTPLVIGYGGNDGSLMGFLRALPSGHIPGRIFWCYREGDTPNDSILEVLTKHNGVLVAIAGFDEFMIQLAQTLFDGFDPSHIDQKIEELSQQRRKRYQEQADKFMASLATASATPGRDEAKDKARVSISHALSDEDKWWTWVLRADSEKDSDKQEKIYREGMKKLPNSAELAGNFALFLKSLRQDYDQAEIYFRKALELDPEDADYVGNYANFLKNQRKDYDAAEAMYKKALELDPNDANHTGNYALFLENQRKDYEAAEAMYKKALELDPNNANHTGNYANFLADQRKDYDAAEAMYKRALELVPNDANHTGNYASFLANQRQDYDAAEAMYKKTLELDPNHANNTANFASLLLSKGDAVAIQQVEPLIRKVIDISGGQPSQTVAEALLYRCLYSELSNGIPGNGLGELKHLFNMGFQRGSWDFSAVFESVLPEISSDRQSIYRAIGDAILNADSVPALDAFPLWRDTPPSNPFAPG